jgi:Methyltransferase domain
MMPVLCSGDRLPFSDGSFDAVVSSDVLEHVPPQKRPDVIAEALRVTRSVAVFGFPNGPAAFDLDHDLYSDYKKRGTQPPEWLEEHMLYPFPTGDLFAELPAGWKMKVVPNESLAFHVWVMRMEMNRWRDRFFRLALLLAPSLVEWLLRRTDREPSYRMIFVLTRDEPLAGM